MLACLYRVFREVCRWSILSRSRSWFRFIGVFFYIWSGFGVVLVLFLVIGVRGGQLSFASLVDDGSFDGGRLLVFGGRRW